MIQIEIKNQYNSGTERTGFACRRALLAGKIGIITIRLWYILTNKLTLALMFTIFAIFISQATRQRRGAIRRSETVAPIPPWAAGTYPTPPGRVLVRICIAATTHLLFVVPPSGGFFFRLKPGLQTTPSLPTIRYYSYHV